MKISELQEGPEREALISEFGADAEMMTVAKGFIETKRTLSSTRRLPGPDGTPEEYSSLYDHLGRPAGPDKYELPDAPDTLKPVLEKLRSVAYEKGLSQEQFAALASQAGAVSVEADTAVSAAKTAWEQSIREKFGDKADSKLEAADSRLQDLLASNPEAADVIRKTGMDRHPALVDLMLKVNNAMNEDTTPAAGSSPPAAAGPSAKDLFTEGMSVMRTEAYKGGQRHPEYPLATARVTEILRDLTALGFDGFKDKRFHEKPKFQIPDASNL